MAEGEASYELRVSRICTAPVPAVFTAFADPAKLAVWSGPSGQHWTRSGEPPPTGSDPGLLEAEGALPGVPFGEQPGRLRLEFCPEPGRKTRLEIEQGPFSERQEVAARAWWNTALGRLDAFLAEN
jgi:hypothetical protein